MEQKFKPILFSTEMVQAILEGRKTQTRRVQKLQPKEYVGDFPVKVSDFLKQNKKYLVQGYNKIGFSGVLKGLIYKESKYQIGDILWVRETFAHDTFGFFYYKAENELPGDVIRWKPSIHMPKEAARIFLKVHDVRCERLQDISEEDAIAEGIEPGEIGFKSYNPTNIFEVHAHWSFQNLWNSINEKKYPWESNPWVWVYTFEKIEKLQNFLP